MRRGNGVRSLMPSASRAAGYAKSVDTRARILAAALEEASHSGLHSASLAGIAARARVAIGNLHYHFGSREGLLHELMGSLVADLMTRLHAVDADDGSDFFERQRAAMLVYMEYLRANPAYVRLADEIKLHEPDLYRHAVAGWVERMAARIRAGIEQKTLRSMDDAEIAAQAHFLLGTRHFLEQMVGQADRRHEAAVVDAYIALLRDGLSRRDGSKRGKLPTARKTRGAGDSKTMDAAARRKSRATKKR